MGFDFGRRENFGNTAVLLPVENRGNGEDEEELGGYRWLKVGESKVRRGDNKNRTQRADEN
jgi:hypothetical protein